MSKESKKPNFLFRAMMIFIIAVLVIVIIVLTSKTNDYEKDKELLSEELTALRLENEKLSQRLEKEMTEEAMIEEAKELGYSNPNDIKFEADIPNA